MFLFFKFATRVKHTNALLVGTLFPLHKLPVGVKVFCEHFNKLMMSQAMQGVPIPTGGNGQFISEWIKSLLSLGTHFRLKQYTYHLCAIALFLSHSIAFSAFATPTKINGLFTIISLHNKQIQILKCINMNYLVLSLLSPVLTSDTSTINKHKTV